jgi:hypothetical protein
MKGIVVLILATFLLLSMTVCSCTDEDFESARAIQEAIEVMEVPESIADDPEAVETFEKVREEIANIEIPDTIEEVPPPEEPPPEPKPEITGNTAMKYRPGTFGDTRAEFRDEVLDHITIEYLYRPDRDRATILVLVQYWQANGDRFNASILNSPTVRSRDGVIPASFMGV